MKKPRSNKKSQVDADELLPKYPFDYRKARSNRFAARLQAETRSVVTVVLDPDVAGRFPTADSVNTVLRALIQTMPANPGR